MYVSEFAVDIMLRFMERRSAKRLGNLRRRAVDIKAGGVLRTSTQATVYPW